MYKKTTVCQKHKPRRILRGMSMFAKVTPAPEPRTDRIRKISLLYAGILVVFALAQLYTFDTFIELIPSFNLPFNDTFAYALAPIIVATEVFALPFLLTMNLSVAFRWVSMILGWIVPALWFFISGWIVITQPTAETVGFLGTVVDLVPGWWAILVSIALGILATWASWGLWPGPRSN